jgi:hypothetical protein
VTIESAYGAYQEQLNTVTGLEAEGCYLGVWAREIEALEVCERHVIDGAARTERERELQLDVAYRRQRRTAAEIAGILEDALPSEPVSPAGVTVGGTWHGEPPYRRPIERQPEPSPVTITAAPEPRAATPVKRPSLLRRVAARMTEFLGSHKPA